MGDKELITDINQGLVDKIKDETAMNAKIKLALQNFEFKKGDVLVYSKSDVEVLFGKLADAGAFGGFEDKYGEGKTHDNIYDYIRHNFHGVVDAESKKGIGGLIEKIGNGKYKYLGERSNSEGDENMSNNIEQGTEQELKKLIDSDVKQIILTGAPGTGKTYIARKVAEDYTRDYITLKNDLGSSEAINSSKEANNNSDEVTNNGRETNNNGEEVANSSNNATNNSNGTANEYIDFIQFHPSYDYTDFIEGLRPIEIEGRVTFKKIDGIFKSFCRKAGSEGNEDKKFFFIIDEINRADLSRVFGELMYGLERDKRGKKNGFKTQYQNIRTYDVKEKAEIRDDIYEEEFYIPENIYVIGTMNDIDRSVESMDFALRRRFHWVEVKANEELDNVFDAENYNGEYIFFPFLNSENGRDKIVEKIKTHIKCLNDFIYMDNKGKGGNSKRSEGEKFLLNRHYHISHGYFADLPDNFFKINDEDMEKIKNSDEEKITEKAKEILEYVWDYRLETLISEYVRGENNGESFVVGCKNIFIPVEADTEGDSEETSGGGETTDESNKGSN